MSERLNKIRRARQLEARAFGELQDSVLVAASDGFTPKEIAPFAGRVPETIRRWIARATECPDCNGWGNGGRCERCGGSGHIPLPTSKGGEHG